MSQAAMSAVRVAGAALCLVVVAACGSDVDGAHHDVAGHSHSEPDAADHNDADTTFAREMVAHHGQAVMMSRLAVSNDAGPRVRALADRIEKAQGPEIEQLTGWLESWGESVGQHSEDMGAAHDMDDMGAGMMSSEDLRQLTVARGAAFDRLFLTQMIEHHEGAVEMAQQLQRNGDSTEAASLAEKVENAQTSEIAEMKRLLR